jgi:hypothetical protein
MGSVGFDAIYLGSLDQQKPVFSLLPSCRVTPTNSKAGRLFCPVALGLPTAFELRLLSPSAACSIEQPSFSRQLRRIMRRQVKKSRAGYSDGEQVASNNSWP